MRHLPCIRWQTRLPSTDRQQPPRFHHSSPLLNASPTAPANHHRSQGWCEDGNAHQKCVFSSRHPATISSNVGHKTVDVKYNNFSKIAKGDATRQADVNSPQRQSYTRMHDVRQRSRTTVSCRARPREAPLSTGRFGWRQTKSGDETTAAGKEQINCCRCWFKRILGPCQGEDTAAATNGKASGTLPHNPTTQPLFTQPRAPRLKSVAKPPGGTWKSDYRQYLVASKTRNKNVTTPKRLSHVHLRPRAWRRTPPCPYPRGPPLPRRYRPRRKRLGLRTAPPWSNRKPPRHPRRCRCPPSGWTRHPALLTPPAAAIRGCLHNVHDA